MEKKKEALVSQSAVCDFFCLKCAVTLSHWPSSWANQRAVRCEIGRARRLPGKCLGGGNERRTTQRDREGWRGGRRAELGGMLMLHWMDLTLVTGLRLLLIQSIFRANLAQLSSLTKLFWLLPHYHKAPSLSLYYSWLILCRSPTVPI